MSEPLKIDVVDLKKLGKGAFIAGLGAGLTYLGAHIGDLSFGDYTPIVVAACSWGVQWVLKWLQKTS